MEEEEKKISKYSSGINIIIRLDTLWRDAHKYRILSQYKKWNIILDGIWLELARDLDKDYEEKEKSFKNIDEKIANTGSIIDNPDLEIGFANLTKENVENRNKQYKLLMEKQLFLARLENKLGKGTTTEDENEDDFD